MRRYFLPVVALLLGASVAAGQAQTVLWQVGTPDRSPADLALSPSRYRDFKSDALYVVGRSQARTDWPCIHPGPGDAWAGNRSHTFTLCFGLLKASDGPARLTLHLHDTHGANPPRLRLALNGKTFEKQLPHGGGDQVLSGDSRAVKPHTVTWSFPASHLRAGVNRLEITTLSGSWFLYDALTLEAPAGLQLDAVKEVAFLQADAPPALVKGHSQPMQPVRVQVQYLGDKAAGVLKVDGRKTAEVALAPGTQMVEAAVPAVTAKTTAAVTLEAGGKTLATASVNLVPVRKWVVYILPHSHVDIGYTALQADVERRQMDHLARGIELARKSAGYPEGSRFRWNTEVLWAVDSYLGQATPQKRREFIDAVKAGWVGVDGMYGNLLTGLCRPEELMRSTRLARDLEAQTGVPVESAMISDVPGYTWGTIPALAQAGIKYWSIGPNLSDRIGTTLQAWEDRPFYWLSPSGKERVLCWVPHKGYSLGHFWGELTPHLFEGLADLERASYPYDITHFRWNVGGDNGPPDDKLADGVRAWNDRYEYPKIIIATTAEAFRAFEKRYGDRLPQVRGDWTPYWEDGAGSSARETALSRNAAERLVQAETLFALRGRTLPVNSFHRAWRNVLLYSEHTWGAHNSISQPDVPFVQKQWAVKQKFALDADSESRELLALAGGPATPGSRSIDVCNTLSWPRTDLVLVRINGTGDQVTDENGQPVPSQRRTTGELAFVARDVPAFGCRRYTLGAGKAQAAANLTLDNGPVRVRIDPATGAITSLASAAGTELVDPKGPGLNSYHYLLGSKPADARSNGRPRVEVGEAGPVVASVRVVSDAPGCRKLTREVRVLAGLDRVELLDTVDKLPVRQKEGVHFGFAFHVPGGTLRLDEPWAVIRPEADQMPGACKNWLTVGRWADVSAASHGVTWASLDAPLVQVGGLTATLIGSQSDPRGWLPRLEPSQKLFSWAMNNHWHTNYRADQEGPTTFRYAVRPHGAYSALEAYQFGTGLSQPLVAVPAQGERPAPPRLRVEPADVVVTAFKPSDDGKADIVRLYGAAGKACRVTLTWAEPPAALHRTDVGERPGAVVTGPVEVPAWGIVTLRAERRAGPPAK
ncbi:MAG: polysaccharide lyase family protein [Gemmataceae bacterium]